jgi:hypothetical protein
MPQEVRAMSNLLQMTKLYNMATGANLAHWEVQEMGYLELEIIMLAIEAR